MSIDFSLIPHHIKMSIAQKQGWADFRKYAESSRHSRDLSQKVRTRFSTNVRELYMTSSDENSEESFLDCAFGPASQSRITVDNLKKTPVQVEFKRYLSNDLDGHECDWLTNLCLSTGMWISNIEVSRISCSREQLEKLLKVAKVCWLTGRRNITDFLPLAAVKHLNLRKCYLTDKKFLSLKMANIHVDCWISTKAINTLLKEWRVGDRVIENVTVLLCEDSEDDLEYEEDEEDDPEDEEDEENDFLLDVHNLRNAMRTICDGLAFELLPPSDRSPHLLPFLVKSDTKTNLHLTLNQKTSELELRPHQAKSESAWWCRLYE